MFLVILISALIAQSCGVRVSEKIYQTLDGDMACFKRFNGTHEVGCTSSFYGNVGILHIPESIADLSSLLEEGSNAPYIIALKTSLFTRDLLMLAKSSSKVSGIIILDSLVESTEPDNYSPFDSCPNERYGLYNETSGSKYSDYCQKNPWNPQGNSIMFESFPFPIFLMQDENSIKGIVDCFGKNSDWPLCGIELHSNMFGATNSEVCYRRTKMAVLNTINYCDPIMDYNIFGSLKPMSGNLTDSSLTFITARADAATLFDNISPGAESSVTGLVTLLAVAKALGNYKTEMENSDKNIMFFLFEAEVWDFLGSFAVTYQMNEGTFPYTPDYSEETRVSVVNYSHIENFIELSQLGIQDADTKVFLFNDPISDSDDSIHARNYKLRETISSAAALNDVSLEYVISDDNTPYPLPPASFQSFLKFSNISGVVLADHGKNYNNKFYQSFMDNARYLNFGQSNSSVPDDENSNALVENLKKIASTVASSAYKIVTDVDKTIEADEDFIKDLLYCYLVNRNCTLFREHAGAYIQRASFFVQRPAKMYASVERGEYVLTNITQNILQSIIGDVIDVAEENCSSGYKDAVHKSFISTLGENGTCINSTVFMQSTKSPAFSIDGYNFSSGEYPSWTESGWQSISARLFLKPDPREEIALVIVGVLMTIITTLISLFCFSKTDTLFERIPIPAHC